MKKRLNPVINTLMGQFVHVGDLCYKKRKRTVATGREITVHISGTPVRTPPNIASSQSTPTMTQAIISAYGGTSRVPEFSRTTCNDKIKSKCHSNFVLIFTLTVQYCIIL